MSTPKTKPELVTRPDQFNRTVRALLDQPIVSVDTESNSLYAYREQVCLIQFSIPGHDYLVDPLALKDISRLGKVFSNPKIEKIFHAAEYDLLTLQRDFGFEFRKLFDTMVAARIMGRKKVGLGSLLEEEFGIYLEKKFQRANWGKRPLPPEMLQYASLDTHFLIRLRNIFAKDLKAAGRWSIAEEDFTRLSQVNGTPPEPNGADVWRVSGVYDLSPSEVTILKELTEYREGQARSMNRPLFKVIGDRTLIAIAVDAPRTLEELAQLPGMSRGQVRRHGKALLNAVKAGQSKPPTKRPRRPRKDDRIIALTDALRDWRKITARKISVESDIVLPRDIMEEIGETMPEAREDLARLMKDIPWRHEKYGDEILEVIRNTRT
jgi:ribonuclease D